MILVFGITAIFFIYDFQGLFLEKSKMFDDLDKSQIFSKFHVDSIGWVGFHIFLHLKYEIGDMI